MPKPARRLLSLAAAAAGLCLVLGGCSGGGSTHHGHVTVTMANQPGTNVQDLLPLITPTYSNVLTLNTIRLLWEPLYQFTSTSGSFDPRLSLAEAPRLSNGGRTATITLKHYRWSGGQPVTARDVQFWENLVSADKAKWSEYVPGQYPDNVTGLSVTGEYTFAVTFDRAYNSTWLLRNALAWMTPLPQFAWDKTSAGGAVGNYDQTPSGAVSVYTFLATQGTTPATYLTNPVWKAVDGPYRLTAYNASTQAMVLGPNPHFSGAPKAQVSLSEVPFTSATAEYDALRSGSLDYGYLPTEDLSTAGHFTSSGYSVSSWYGAELNFVVLNYANPTVGPLFRQEYIRQALQEVIDEPAYVSHILSGYGHPTYGPVPSFPKNNYTSPAQAHPKFTYAPKQALGLLQSHGWAKNSSGHLACTSPGSGPGQCGQGIASGQQLALKMIYTTGSNAATAQSAAFASAAGRVGIQIALSSLTFDSIFSAIAPGSASWDMAWWGGANSSWNFLQDYPVPAQMFSSRGSFNLGEYTSSQMDSALNRATTESGTAGLEAVSAYGATTVPNLWMPIQPYQVSVIRKTVKGALPQPATETVYPQLWTVSS